MMDIVFGIVRFWFIRMQFLVAFVCFGSFVCCITKRYRSREPIGDCFICYFFSKMELALCPFFK